MMKVMRIVQPTGAAGLKLDVQPTPEIGPFEIRVKVNATAVNRSDLLQSMGRYPAPPGVPADIPGLEYAGEVVAIGSHVQRWKPGARVMGLVAGGAWAEALVTHEHEAMAIPETLSDIQAAAISEAFMTAWDALIVQANMQLGHRVLIHAATSGVGTAATQLINAAGAVGIGSSRSQQKLERTRALGLDETLLVESSEPRFAKAILEMTQGRGVDVVLDLVGGTWLPETLQSTAIGGTIVLVGLVAGSSAEVPLTTLLSRRLHLKGTVLRSRPQSERIELATRFEKEVLPQFRSQRLKPIIDAVLPVHEAGAALARLAASDTFGKLVLTW